MALTRLSPPSSLFGVPLSIEWQTTEELIRLLQAAWASNHGRSPRSLEEDARALKTFFDPIASGGRLRRELERVAALPNAPRMSFDDAGIFVRLGTDRMLVRPEGRVLLEVLLGAASSSDGRTTQISPADVAAATDWVYRKYAAWGSQRLDVVVEGLVGSRALQGQALGFLLWLLVNRCTHPDRALPREKSKGRFRDTVDEAVGRPIAEFARPLKQGGKTDGQKFALYSAWQVSETKRRLGNKLVLGDVIYLEPDHVNDALRILCDDLMSRRGITYGQVSLALSAFQDAFDASITELAGFDLHHSRPSETQRLHRVVLDRAREGA